LFTTLTGTTIGSMSEPRTCTMCHNEPAGPGGILCPGCRASIEAANQALATNQAAELDDEGNTAAPG
jgi:hypothetical protein